MFTIISKGEMHHVSVKQFKVGLCLALTILVLLIITIYFLAQIKSKQDESFKRFIQAEKAGIFQGVTMSPLADPKTYKHEGQWQIAGAGDNTKQTKGVVEK